MSPLAADGSLPPGSCQYVVSTTAAAAAGVYRLPGVEHHRLENREAALELGEGVSADAELGSRSGIFDKRVTPVIFSFFIHAV